MQIVDVVDDLDPIARMQPQPLIATEMIERHLVPNDRADRKDDRRVLSRPFEGRTAARRSLPLMPSFPLFVLLLLGRGPFPFVCLVLLAPFAFLALLPPLPFGAVFRALLAAGFAALRPVCLLSLFLALLFTFALFSRTGAPSLVDFYAI